MFVFTQVIWLFITFGYAHPSESIVKCCDHGLILNEFMKCELALNSNSSLETIMDLSGDTIDINTTCSLSSEKEVSNSSSEIQTFNLQCADIDANGTLIFQHCSFIHRYDEHKSQQCESLFTPLKFWGASIVIFASSIYILPYSTVVVLYCVMPDLRRKAFDKAVMNFCLLQVFTAAILCILGYFVLCHERIPSLVYSFAGLTLMFLTISTVLWMLTMCFDVTLTITRFRWAPSSSSNDHYRKFFMYARWVYSGAFIPTTFVGTLELLPYVPKDWIIKPNFERFDDTNVAVIAYVIAIPLLVCLTNNVLFVYTSWKMFQIQKSTSMVNENRKSNAREKYFTYLKLYLLMDAPWVTSSLGAVYPDLWILKLFRMIHPILLLMTILPRKMIVRFVRCSKETDFVKKSNTQKEENVTTDKKLSTKANNSPRTDKKI